MRSQAIDGEDACWRLLVVGCGVHVACCGLCVVGCGLRGAGCGPFDLGFRIWDLGLKRLIGWVAKDEMWRIDFWIVVLYFK